ncbi:MAG: hypothetical protein AAF202_13550, partial [Pseudomonadota bacterium]
TESELSQDGLADQASVTLTKNRIRGLNVFLWRFLGRKLIGRDVELFYIPDLRDSRTALEATTQTEADGFTLLVNSEISVNPMTRMVSAGGHVIRLTSAEYMVLEEILFSDDASISPEELVASVSDWGHLITADSLIESINEKLSPFYSNFIESTSGRVKRHFIRDYSGRSSERVGVFKIEASLNRTSLISDTRPDGVPMTTFGYVPLLMDFLAKKPALQSDSLSFYNFLMNRRVLEIDVAFETFKRTLQDNMLRFNASYAELTGRTEQPLVTRDGVVYLMPSE